MTAAKDFAAANNKEVFKVIETIDEIELEALDEFGGKRSNFRFLFVAELD